MKFLGKWMELENINLSEVTQLQMNTSAMHSVISGYLPRGLEYPRHNSDYAQEEGRTTDMDILVLLRRGNKIPTEGDTKTKCGEESEGMSIQRLSHLLIHPIYSYKTQTLLLMPTRTCCPDLDIAVTWEALLV